MIITTLVPLVLISVAPAPAQVNVQGQWQTISTQMTINPAHVALLHNGKVLVVSGSGAGANSSNLAGIFDPSTQSFTTQSVGYDMFCNGMVIMPDGRPIIVGGTVNNNHTQQTSVYDPATGQFSAFPLMAHGRWYPNVAVLNWGTVQTFSGLDELNMNQATNDTVEWLAASSWITNPIATGWAPPTYPRAHVLPNGNVFFSGPQIHSHMESSLTGQWTLNLATTNFSIERTYGTSVLLPLSPANNYAPKVMIMGGTTPPNPATNTTELIDLSVSSPTWIQGPAMSQARVEMNATILPNGKVLAYGGAANEEDSNHPSLAADLYDPTSPPIGAFNPAGSNAVARLYHSTGILLPDATVLVMGSQPGLGLNPPVLSYDTSIEIYKPPYLFNSNGTLATRPTITSLPATIKAGQSFQISTPDAANISSVVLMRPGAVTHHFDMEQRLVNLSFTKGSGVLTVTAPPDEDSASNVFAPAPMGYYLVFILNSSGVPSVGQFTQLNRSATILRPTSFSIPSIAYTPYANPGNASDGILASAATPGISSVTGENYSGIPAAGGTPASLNLKITSAVANGLSGSFIDVTYSTDGGSTFNYVYYMQPGGNCFGDPKCSTASSRARQTDVISLPVSQNLANVIVGVACFSCGSTLHQVYEIWVEAK